MMLWRLSLGLVLGCVLGASPAQAAATPGLVLNPTQGPPMSAVTFNGSGFCGSCGAVSVKFGNVVVANSVAVDGNGAIQGAFEVPAGPAGYQQVVATQSGSPDTATARFFVGPSLPQPSGPQPTVTFVPSPGPTPIVSTVPQTEPQQTDQTPGTVAGSNTPSDADASGAQSKGASAGRPWLPWLIVGVVLAAAAGAVIPIQLRRRRSSGRGGPEA
jgi:hypothetical protein